MDDLLRTDTNQDGGRITLALKGELDVSNAADLIDQCADAVAARPTALNLDLSELTYTDSIGLSVLVTAYVQCMESGVPLRILTPNLFIDRLLQVTGLDDLFRVPQYGDALVSG